MQDLDEILKTNKEALDKHIMRDSRIPKDSIYIPYEAFKDKTNPSKEKEIIGTKETFDKLKNIQSVISKSNNQNEIKPSKVPSKPYQQHELDLNINSFLDREVNLCSGVYDNMRQMALNDFKINDEKVNNLRSNFGGEFKNQGGLRLSDDTRELLMSVYGYLYDLLETFYAVYPEDYSKIFANIISFRTFIPNKTPSPINIEKFLRRFREVDNLGTKVNIIASSLGNYNLHILVDKFSSTTIFMTSNKDSILASIITNYNGSIYDLAYLKEFNKVVEADLSGKYVFNDLEGKEEKTSLEDSNNIPKIEKPHGLFPFFKNKKS